MQDKKLLKFFFVFTLLCSLSFTNAQTKNSETQYHINLDLGAGYSYYLTSMNFENLSIKSFYSYWEIDVGAGTLNSYRN